MANINFIQILKFTKISSFKFGFTFLIILNILEKFHLVGANLACSFPGCPAHGSVVFSNEIFEEGTIASYYCERGFELLGPARRICEQGTWSPPGIPFCVINIATGKAPMQISTEDHGVSQKAIDSSTSLFYDKKTCTLTKAEKNPWWYVNLLEPYMVQLIRLDFGKSCCGKKPASVVVRVGNNRPDMGTNPVCNRFVGYVEEGQPLFLPCNPPMPGAFVSVHLENDEINQLSICEAFVYTDQALPIERCPSFRDQPPGATASYNGKCYMFYNKQFLNFDSAQALCESRNGTLINEINPALQGFISWELWRRHRNGLSSHYWLGIVRNKTTKVWKWINGGHVLVSFWNNGDNYGDCAIFDGSKGWLWTVAECDLKLNFICQHKPNACGNPEQPPNSTIIANKGFEVGSKVFYLCDLGHLLVGSPVRECLETGFYDEFPPVCKYIDCDRPASIPSGSFVLMNEMTTYESIVKYSCNPGYEIQGKSELKCDMDGRWNGPPPSCQIIECETLTSRDKNIIIDIKNGTLYQSVVKIKCKNGYELVGANTIICLENGLWDNELPKCTRKEPKTIPTSKLPKLVSSTTITSNEEIKEKKIVNKIRKNQEPNRNSSKITNVSNNNNNNNNKNNSSNNNNINNHNNNNNNNNSNKSKSKLIIENNNIGFTNDHKRNQLSYVEAVNTKTKKGEPTNTILELNFASGIAIAAFAGFIILSATITSIVLLCKRANSSHSHYKQKTAQDCKTIASIDSSISNSTNGLNRYYRQAWENLHEFSNKSNINYNCGIKTKKEYPESSKSKRHHHHHHHHRNDNQCNFVAPSKRH